MKKVPDDHHDSTARPRGHVPRPTAADVQQRNPQHPGAAHFTIHSFDDPEHARLGLRAADLYAQIAPEAPHALHMPTHIYVQLGMWDRVLNSNEAAWAASVKWQETKGLSLALMLEHLSGEADYDAARDQVLAVAGRIGLGS